MKKLLVGLILAMTAVSSQAALTIVRASDIEISGYDGEPESVTGDYSSGSWGFLRATEAGTFTATYLGSESGYDNAFRFSGFGRVLTESNSIGDSFSTDISAGRVRFGFLDSTGARFNNGQRQTDVLGFAILEGRGTEFGTFDYIIGFNDSAIGDADYDDFVVGVKFVAAAVPEPETYAMLLAGLGIVGFTARRRKNINA